MDRYFVRLWAVGMGLLLVASSAAEPYPRISEEAFSARLPFFDYDPGIPLDARVVQEWVHEESVRQKFVFRGAQGFLVPGFLEVPAQASSARPLVLLLHGWSGSKNQWYEEGNIVSGGEMRKALLEGGYAVCALDAATHGERSHEIDYQHVNPHTDPQAPPRVNYFTFAEITVQTVKDYRRALDYLSQRPEIDAERIGLIGYSMGGMDAFFLLSVEPRIKAAVACVPPLTGGYGATAPIDYTWGVKNKALLLLMGREDDMYEEARVSASYREYLESSSTRLVWYDRPHKLGPVYVPDALAWIRAHI